MTRLEPVAEAPSAPNSLKYFREVHRRGRNKNIQENVIFKISFIIEGEEEENTNFLFGVKLIENYILFQYGQFHF